MIGKFFSELKVKLINLFTITEIKTILTIYNQESNKLILYCQWDRFGGFS